MPVASITSFWLGGWDTFEQPLTISLWGMADARVSLTGMRGTELTLVGVADSGIHLMPESGP